MLMVQILIALIELASRFQPLYILQQPEGQLPVYLCIESLILPQINISKCSIMTQKLHKLIAPVLIDIVVP